LRTGMVAFIALLITLIVAVILYFYNREIGLFMLGAATSALVDLARITLKTTIQEFMSNRKARERMKRTIRDDYTRLLIIIQNPNLRSRIELVDRLDDLQYLLETYGDVLAELNCNLSIIREVVKKLRGLVCKAPTGRGIPWPKALLDDWISTAKELPLPKT